MAGNRPKNDKEMNEAITWIEEDRLAKCIRGVVGENGSRFVSDNGTRTEGWSIILHEGAPVDSIDLEKLRLRFNTEFRDDLTRMGAQPLAYWILHRVGNGWAEIRYIQKDWYMNQPEEVKDIKRYYEDTVEDTWILFKERRPKRGQRIIVRTYSGLFQATNYDPRKDLEGICDAWQPAQKG